MTTIQTYSFLDTVAASGADTMLTNSTVKMKGAPDVKLGSIMTAQILDPQVVLREVVTLTPTQSTAIGQVYSFRVNQLNKTTGTNISKVFAYTAITAADSATVISNALRAVIGTDAQIDMVASGTATLVLTASASSPNFEITVVSAGAGLSQATTFVDGAGSVVVLGGSGTYANSTITGTGTPDCTLNMIITSGTQTGLVEGMRVNVTLTGNDTITLQDGTVLIAGAVFNTRIGAVVNGAATSVSFKIGQLYDSNIALISSTATSRVAALAPTYARGLGSELASRGIVGATAATTYTEVSLSWLETPQIGGVQRARKHSTFVSGASGANLLALRYQVMNSLHGTAASTSSFTTTFTSEAVSAL